MTTFPEVVHFPHPQRQKLMNEICNYKILNFGLSQSQINKKFCDFGSLPLLSGHRKSIHETRGYVFSSHSFILIRHRENP